MATQRVSEITGNLHSEAQRLRQVRTSIGDMKPNFHVTEKNGHTRFTTDSIEVEGVKLKPSKRFDNSLCSRFGFSPSIFNLFDPGEVFERIQGSHRDSIVKLTVLDNDTLLAVTSPDKPAISMIDIAKGLRNSERPPVSAYFDPAIASVVATFNSYDEKIGDGGEDFKVGFRFTIPVDGYGSADAVLSMLRMVCSNGLIAEDSVFRSHLNLGKSDFDRAIQRVAESFQNEDGVNAITNRIATGNKTPASLAEYVMFDNAVGSSIETSKTGGNTSALFEQISKIAGSVADKFKVPSINFVSEKKRRILPMNCSVGDLINMATEIRTHHRDLLKAPGGTPGHVFSNTRYLDGFVGSMLSREFDLEGTEHKGEARDFYFAN